MRGSNGSTEQMSNWRVEERVIGRELVRRFEEIEREQLVLVLPVNSNMYINYHGK